MGKTLFLLSLIGVFIFSAVALGRVGGGDVLFAPEKAKEVIFTHDNHVGSIGLKCTDCHDALYHTKEKHKKVTMAQMQKGQSCGSCHNGKRAFDLKGNCDNCHKK